MVMRERSGWWQADVSGWHRALRLVATVVLVCLVIAPTMGQAQSDPSLRARFGADAISVSFDLRPDRVDQLDARLVGSEPVSVTWLIELRQRVKLWRDLPLARATFQATARRVDASDLFSITTRSNGESSGAAVQVPRSTAYRLLTSFPDLNLFATDATARGADYLVTVSAVVEGGDVAPITTRALARAPVTR